MKRLYFLTVKQTSCFTVRWITFIFISMLGLNSYAVKYSLTSDDAAIAHIPAIGLLNGSISDCTWTGSGNPDWNNPLNWCAGQIPTTSTNVIIPSGVNQPIISAGAFCNNMTINVGATLTISGSNTLTVNGNWINNGTFTANTSTVIFDGAAQNIDKGTFVNFTLAGSGRKTLSGVIVNGILSMEGTATVSAVPTYGATATLQYNTSTARTAGAEWINTFAATGGIIIKNTGTITLNAGKQIGQNTKIPLNINLGSTLISTSTGSPGLIFHGDLINKGTFIVLGTEIKIGGSTVLQKIDGFTTNGKVTINKTSGTAIFQGNVSGVDLYIAGSGILNLGEGLMHTFTGTISRNGGTLNGGSSLLRIRGSVTGKEGIFFAGTGTIEYNSFNNQTCTVVEYNNLTLSGAGTKTFDTTPIVNGILSLEGMAAIVVSLGVVTYGANATLQYNNNTTSPKSVSSDEWINPFTATGGIVISNTGTIKLNAAKTFAANVPLTINFGATLNTLSFPISFSSSSTVIIDGTFQTANCAGFSGAEGSAITSTSSTIIYLGGNSTIEYNGNGIQTVSHGTYHNLTTSGSGIKTIASGSAVTVDGNLITNGLLALNSDATNTGSLIVNGSSSGNISFNRYMTGTRWYITSAPVNVTSGFNNTTNGDKIHVDASLIPNLYDFATYSEQANDWLYSYESFSPSNLPGSLIPGEGYLISLKPESDGIIQFTGELNNGSVNKPVTSTTNNGWNAVGNPFTSAIGITSSATSTENFLTKNQNILTPSFAAIYVWNETSSYNETQQYYKIIGNSGYVPAVGNFTPLTDNYIQAGQGFLIHSNANSNVTFTKEMQVHNAGLILKSANISWPGITLLAESNGQTRSTVVAFNENMTTGLDVTYDAGLLASDYFQVYTHLVSGDNAVDFAIQCLPDNQYIQLAVPIGIDLPEGGDLVFKASGIILPDGLYPVIEDRVLKVTTPLKNETDSYSVTLAKKNKGIGRFYLSFGGITLTKPEVSMERKFTATLANNRITINGAVEPETKAMLFDICGRKIGEYTLVNKNRNEITIFGLDQRFYLLKIEGKNHSEVLKLFAVKTNY